MLMFPITAVVQAVRRSLPFEGGRQSLRDGHPPEPASAPASTPSDIFTETGRTPEDHVIELCRSHGGRIKQTAIIAQTGWSASNVSRLLTEMEAEGRIDRVKAGKEKVVGLPGTLPESSEESPVNA